MANSAANSDHCISSTRLACVGPGPAMAGPATAKPYQRLDDDTSPSDVHVTSENSVDIPDIMMMSRNHDSLRMIPYCPPCRNGGSTSPSPGRASGAARAQAEPGLCSYAHPSGHWCPGCADSDSKCDVLCRLSLPRCSHGQVGLSALSPSRRRRESR